MAAAQARRAGQAMRTGLAWLAGMAAAAGLAAVMFWPRRLPDLARFVRGTEFVRLQSAASAWVDENFALIERGAPWLDRAGRQVTDVCETGTASRTLRIPRDPLSVTCSREVTVVYGLDGRLQDRLGGLAVALGAAGWGSRDGDTTVPLRALGRDRPPEWPVNWSPVPGFALPAMLETMPPARRFPLKRWLGMGIGWISRGEPADLVTTTATSGQAGLRAATATAQPVEISGSDVTGLAGQALARHEHAIAIRITIGYYLNANINARPGRLRKRVLPALPARA